MTKEDIIRMAWKAGFERLGHTDNDWVCYPEDIERFAALVAQYEREECAKICDEFPDVGYVGNKLTSDYHSYLIRKMEQA